MKFAPGAFLSIISLLTAFTACSFDYGNGLAAGAAVPEMILTDVVASRYENAQISMILSAQMLEMYDGDSVWAGEGVSFVQYARDGTGDVEAEGSAGLLLVDDSDEIYSLGEGITFHLVTDDLLFRAEDLQWTKKTHRLSSPVSGEVSIEESDGSVIKGTGFFADTLARVYEFSAPVSGQLASEGE